jgi:hypothetical protein
VFESIKILFDVIESLFREERHIKILPDKALIRQKDCMRKKKKETKNLGNPNPYRRTCIYMCISGLLKQVI